MRLLGGPGPAESDRIARAYALLRALTGVLDARIQADHTGIQAISVVADPALSAWEVARNVQSALLASLGLAIDRALVEVRRPGTPAPPDGAESPPTPVIALQPHALAPEPVTPPVVHANGNGHAPANGNGSGAPRANGKLCAHPHGSAPAAGTALHAVAGRDGSLPPPIARSRRGASLARLEIEAHQAGRVTCRVVVATADRIAAGEVDGIDTPAGRLEATARAVIASAPFAGAELEGIRDLELAGRQYVIVAVRRWSGHESICRADLAQVESSAETAAALATLGALLQ